MPSTVTSRCPRCDVTFQQPYDPGRRREYCSNACRQAAYRARVRTEKAKERYESFRERSRRQDRYESSRGRPTDAKAKARDKITKLLAKAASTTFEPERNAFRAKAEEIAARHGLKINYTRRPQS